MRTGIRRHQRRGILLLLVLSLLVLFVLVGTTFIIVAGHYKAASDAVAKNEQKGEAPDAQLDSVVLDLLRGAKGNSSPLGQHNLLNDTYGTDGFIGRVTPATVAAIGNGQLIQLEFFAQSRPVDPMGVEIPAKQPELNQRPLEFQSSDYYAGSLFTVLTGPLANQTTRIVRYLPPTMPNDTNGDGYPDVFSNGTIVLEFFDDAELPNPAQIIANLNVAQFLVNGRMHNGTGAGYDAAAGDLEEVVDFGFGDLEVALLPFYQQPVDPTTGLPFNPLPALPFPSPNVGGLDEGWDAADYQNVFLGLTADPTLNLNSIPAPRVLEALNIPSFHRPFLVNYWVNRIPIAQYQALSNSTIGGLQTVPLTIAANRFRSGIIARPLGNNHPLFNGGNVAFTHPGFVNGGNLATNEFNKDGDNIPDFMDPDVYESDGVTISTAGGDGTLDDFRLVTGQPGADGLLDMPLVSGPWDVDNDNDGTPDSVWLDLGYPIQSTKDGRLYKPLFAILCVDLDGRLNVNAHGSVDQLEAAAYPLVYGGTPLPITNTNSPAAAIIAGLPYTTAGNAIPANVDTLWGQGYGPPDVSLARVFASLSATPTEAINRYENLLARRLFGRNIVGVNVETLQRGAYFPGPGRQSTPDATGETPWTEPVNYFSEIGVPADYTTAPNSYMTPPDLRGRGTLVADRHGQPFYFKIPRVYVQSTDLETINDPYETNLVEPNAYDSIYSVTELEAVYRFYDLDSTKLDQRLAAAIGVADWGKLFTTNSSSMSTSTAVVHPAARGDGLTLTQAFKQELASHPLNASIQSPDWLQQQVVAMLPPELRAGRKMDVNRLFGDGLDGTSGLPGIIDDPQEFDTNNDGVVDLNDNDTQYLWRDLFGNNVPGKFFHPIPTITDGAGNSVTIPIPTYAPARQTYARQLYCLAMFLLRDYEIPVSDPSMSQTERNRYKARKLAQWAINVVDFRDADSIMTPFEFDLDPFAEGWNADGNLNTPTTNTEVVWGVEQPELLITETVAFHDRGVRDLDTETPDPGEMAKLVTDMMDPDDDLDQYKKPQGSLFLELTSPRSPRWNRTDNVHAYGLELYNANAQLDLGRFIPGSAPVWRVAITQHTSPENSYEASAATDPGILERSMIRPFSLFEQSIDRIIWFANVAPTAATAARPEIVYYNMSGVSPLLTPGQIAVVGPRPKTSISSSAGGDDTTNQEILLNPRIPQFIEGNQVNFKPAFVNAEYPAGGGPLLIQCGRPWPRPSYSGDVEWNVGVNISEPYADPNNDALYYPDPDPTPDELAENTFVYHTNIRDTPIDEHPNGDPFVTGKIENYATAFLQRLANPLIPWNPVFGSDGHNPAVTVNPYITVDWAPIDLDIYNGEAVDGLDEGMGAPPPGQPVEFVSRERSGETNAPGVPDPNRNIWVSRSDSTDRTFKPIQPSIPTATHRDFYADPITSDFFKMPLVHSLGYLNPAFGINTNPGGNHYPPQVVVPGDPATGLNVPYPMLAWHNRPFASAMELMQVPASSAGMLVFDFVGPSVNNSDPYEVDPGNDRLNFAAPYGHLLNFFQSSDDPIDGPNLAMLLDLLEVPSRFVGTEKYLNPQQSTAALFTGGSLLDDEFAAPFNRISKFRDPGKINLNTINSPAVLYALNSGAENYVDFLESRQLRDNADIRDLPTRFGNPFRPVSAADLMPISDLQPSRPVEASLLREDPGAAERPLFNDGGIVPYANREKNSSFRYQHLQRLDNMVTTQSNVFAVWITVGYFEVLPWNANYPMDPTASPDPDFAHPDGYQLGQEIGIDTGEVERHRAFYIIDRSKPVAFQPGENHNVEDAILLKRFIE